MGIKSIFVIFKLKWWKLTIFGGWGGRYHGIVNFYSDHTVAFYAIIIIILLIVVYVIYLESDSEADYLIRPYQVLLGISLIAIVIYIIATAPEQKESEYFQYEYGEYVDPYKKEKDWILYLNNCPKSGDEKDIKYCSEIKEACSEIIIVHDKKVSTCVAEVRERLGMPLVAIDLRRRYDLDPNIYHKPLTNIEKRWGDMSSEQKLSIVRNVFQTGTTYDKFPDWMKNDPVVMEIKEELQKTNANE